MLVKMPSKDKISEGKEKKKMTCVRNAEIYFNNINHKLYQQSQWHCFERKEDSIFILI